MGVDWGMQTLLSLFIVVASLITPTPAKDKVDFAELEEIFIQGLERAFKAAEDAEASDEDMVPRACVFGYCASCKDYHSPAQCSVSCTISGPGWTCDGACTSDMGCGGKCW